MTDLEAASGQFAAEIQTLITRCFDTSLEVRAIHATDGRRFIVQFYSEDVESVPLPLKVGGEELASLGMSYLLGFDRSGKHLKTVSNYFVIKSVLDRTPLFRFEYRNDHHTAPIAHWQIHAERGALSHLLAHAWQRAPRKHPEPHLLSSLHLPVGGERNRPCLEDVIQFLIEECGVDRLPTWRDAVESGREVWRRRQLKATVRDAPVDAAAQLVEMGYLVKPPEGGQPDDNEDVLRQW